MSYKLIGGGCRNISADNLRTYSQSPGIPYTEAQEKHGKLQDMPVGLVVRYSSKGVAGAGSKAVVLLNETTKKKCLSIVKGVDKKTLEELRPKRKGVVPKDSIATLEQAKEHLNKYYAGNKSGKHKDMMYQKREKKTLFPGQPGSGKYLNPKGPFNYDIPGVDSFEEGSLIPGTNIISRGRYKAPPDQQARIDKVRQGDQSFMTEGKKKKAQMKEEDVLAKEQQKTEARKKRALSEKPTQVRYITGYRIFKDRYIKRYRDEHNESPTNDEIKLAWREEDNKQQWKDIAKKMIVNPKLKIKG